MTVKIAGGALFLIPENLWSVTLGPAKHVQCDLFRRRRDTVHPATKRLRRLAQYARDRSPDLPLSRHPRCVRCHLHWLRLTISPVVTTSQTKLALYGGCRSV